MAEPFDIASRRGHRLSGRLERPQGVARGWALFAHCFTCDKNSHAAVRLGRGLAARGIGMLRFDFSGLGESGGEFGRGLDADVEDLLDAAAAMRAAKVPAGLLIGHSFGGAAVLAAAGLLPEVRAVVTLAAPFDVKHVLKHVHAGGMFGRTDAVKMQGRVFKLAPGFHKDLSRQNQADRVAKLKRPLLVMHSPTDTVVGIENAAAIFAAAKHPKSFVSLGEADHLLGRSGDADYAAGLISAWVEPYLRPA